MTTSALGSALVFWLAHWWSEVVGEQITIGEAFRHRDALVVARREWPLVEAALVPTLLLTLAWAGVWSRETGAALALGAALLQITGGRSSPAVAPAGPGCAPGSSPRWTEHSASCSCCSRNSFTEPPCDEQQIAGEVAGSTRREPQVLATTPEPTWAARRGNPRHARSALKRHDRLSGRRSRVRVPSLPNHKPPLRRPFRSRPTLRARRASGRSRSPPPLSGSTRARGSCPRPYAELRRRRRTAPRSRCRAAARPAPRCRWPR